MGRLKTAHLGNDVRRSILLQDLGQLDGLVVALDVLEQERHLDGAEQVVDGSATLRQLGGRPDEALLAAQLAQRRAAHPLDLVLQRGVAEAPHDLVDVVLLGLRVDLVLVDDQRGRLAQHVAHEVVDLLVVHRLVDQRFAPLLAVVGRCCVPRVHREQLALDERLQVVDEVHALDLRVLRAVERLQLHAPLVELLDLDVQARVGVLVRHDAVNGAIGEPSFAVDVALHGLVELVKDEALQGVCGADGVLAGNDGERILKLAAFNTLGDDGSDELEDVGSDGTGHRVGGGNLLDDLWLLVFGVDCSVVVNVEDALTILANLGDLVAGLRLESVDDAVHDIDEDDFISGIVEEFGNEATGCCEQLKFPLFSSRILLDGSCVMTYRPILPPPKWTAFFPVILSRLSCVKVEVSCMKSGKRSRS